MAVTIETSRISRAGKFGAVGILGLFVNVLAQVVFADALGINYLIAAALATQVSSTVNFLLAERWVFDSASANTRRGMRYIAFLGMNNAALALRAPIMWVLTSQLGLHYSLSNLVSLAIMTVVRFGVADSLIWRVGPAAPAAALPLVTTPDVVTAAAPSAAARAPWAWWWARAQALTAERVALTMIALTAVMVRLVDLTSVGLNSDEAVYAGQGAALFDVGGAPKYFSLFRAHPLLLQGVVGAAFKVTGQSDFVARLLVAMLFGVGSVVVTYLLGRVLAGRTVGLLAAATCAVLPYHVIVSRQVLVDTAMGFFAALSLVLVLQWMRRGTPALYLGAFAAAGCAALSKEIAVLLVPILLYATWLKGRGAALKAPLTRWAIGLYVPLVLPFPLTRMISQSRNASAFFLWQFGRDPNHEALWFGRVMMQYITPPVIAFLVVGAATLCLRRRADDRVVLAYLGTFLVFFTAWPTKLFPYLFLLVPPMAVLAAIGLLATARRLSAVVRAPRHMHTVVGALLAGMLVFLSVLSVRAVTVTGEKDVPGMADFDVEVQSFAGTKEFAEWARTTPVNSRFLTIGPSLGNILRFYGERDSVAMSVSVDPLKRNPAYVPIPNPDRSLRELQVQYVVWDTYSADRSTFYSLRTLAYARKFGGQVVFSAYADDHGHLHIVHGPPPDGVRPRLMVFSVDGGPLSVEDPAGGGS